MLVITCRTTRYQFTLGERNPFFYMEREVDLVACVQADGPELSLIATSMTGIPHGTNAVQRWYGDDAKFITANLNLGK